MESISTKETERTCKDIPSTMASRNLHLVKKNLSLQDRIAIINTLLETLNNQMNPESNTVCKKDYGSLS